MKSSEENQTLEDPEIKGSYTEMAKANTVGMSDFDRGIEKASEVNVNFNQNILDDIRAEPNPDNSNMLSSDLYDAAITEVCLGDFISDKEKPSGSGSNLTEMNRSNESPINNAKEDNNNDEIDKITTNVFENMIKKDGNAEVIHIDSRKRPLSPNRSNPEETESKRVKYDDDDNTLANSSNQPHTTQSDIVDAVTDNCLPIAVVAPLGFSEDLFIDAPSLKEKDKANVKQDIASLLDTFDDSDEKSLTLFDADFDKIKSDIISSNSFKTPDGNCWTFDIPSSGFDNLFEKESPKSDMQQNRSQSEEKRKNIEDSQEKKSFNRQPSVEHDIRDFEKVLNNIMQKGSQSINSGTCGKETVSTHLLYTLPRNSITTSQCHQSPNQPCQHVANSDLLRELLDQKTETTSAQAKRRQEIDLSFLQPDVVAGKGLSVSSDKILQTRTIDPRLTSKPYVESSRNAAQNSSVNFPVVAQSTSNTSIMKPTVSCNTAVSSTNRDPISLAEQRRASITLHHKVPPYDVPNSSLTSLPSNDESATSNIIKEAFDFATEITDHGYESVRSNNPSPRYDNRLPGMNGTTNPQIGTMFTSEQRVRPQNDFFPDGLQNKTASMSNRQIVGNRPPLNINSTGLRMKFEGSNVRNYYQTRSIRPNSVEQDSSITSHNLEFPAVVPNSRSQNFPSIENKVAPNGAYLSDGDIRGMQLSNSISVQVDPQFRMDPMQSQSLVGEQSHNLSNRNSDRSQVANMMQRNSQQKYTVTPSMGYQPNAMNQSGYTMPHQGQAMRRPMPGPDLLQIAPDDPIQSRLPDFGSSSRGGMGMVRPDNNLQIGMQERIRAMNVQQWYRRRIQAQMNRFPQQQHQPQEQMMHRPGMGVTGLSGHDTVRPHAPLAGMNNPPRQGTNVGMQRYGYSMDNIQGQNQYQNKVGQGHGQMSYQQYMDQRSQRITDMQIQNQMRTSRSFNVGNPADNTGNGMEQTVFPDSLSDFDVKQQSHSSPGSEMFPFNI